MHPNGQTAYFTENFRVRQLDLTQDPPVASDLVGGGSSGSSDGTGTAASFNNYITGLCFSPDASFMVVNDRGNNKLRKVDMNTLEVTTLMSGKANMDGGCAFKPDGNSLLVCQKNSNQGSGFNGILEIDFATGAVTEIAGASHGLAGTSSDGTGSGATFGAPSGIKITKDGAYAYISQYHDGDLRKMDLQTLEVTTVASVPKWCGDFTLTPDESTAIIGYNTGSKKPHVVDLTTGTYTALSSSLPVGNSQGLTISQDGSTIYVANQYVGNIIKVV